MLRYLSSGIRRFGTMPIGLHSRLNWEFYAVVKGRCGVLLDSGEKLPLRSSCLWVFPPHHIHGWHGERRHCSVAVIHCGSVPWQLVEAVPPQGFLVRSLSEAECRQIQDLAHSLEPDFHDRNALSELRFDRAIIDLALLALSGVASAAPSSADRRVMEKVDEAVAWFRHHLRQQPGIEDVAAAVHVSSSHLRRLFITVRGQGPRAVLANAQVDVAMRLLAESDLKIESVAAESGFTSARDFSRVFSARKGCSPSEWRRKVQPPYVEPETGRNIHS
jgi:AraC family transcriptional regulator